MNPFQREPSLIAIFFDQQKLKIWETKKISNHFVENFLQRLFLCFENLPIFTNLLFTKNYNLNLIQTRNEIEFLLDVMRHLPPSQSEDEDIDEVYFVYLEGISPVLDISLTNQLKERHKKYLSQYSYSENLPNGIVPYFISREFLQTIPKDYNGKIHDYLLKNINQYDTEIFFHPPDLRHLRLSFNLDSLRSVRLVQDILSKNPELKYEEIFSFLKENLSSFRAYPSYIEIEIYKGCKYSCDFCPRTFADLKDDNSQMNPIILERILHELETEFGSPVTICFGGLGEPLLHKEFFYFLKFCLNQSITQELILETALYTNFEELVTCIKNLNDDQLAKLTIIVNLPSLQEGTYFQLTKQNQTSVKNILNNLQILKTLLLKENLYVQILKIQETEDELENYMNFFDKENIQVIIQKYNSYANKMKERRVTDFTPIQREFCWHLFRDLYISYNGDVHLCKQLGGTILGNIQEMDLVNLWNQGLRYATDSFNHNNQNIPAPCLNCDEWYTFNA